MSYLEINSESEKGIKKKVQIKKRVNFTKESAKKRLQDALDTLNDPENKKSLYQIALHNQIDYKISPNET